MSGMTGDGLKTAILSAINSADFTSVQVTAILNLSTAIVTYIQSNAVVTLNAFSGTAPAGGGPVVFNSGTGKVG